LVNQVDLLAEVRTAEDESELLLLHLEVERPHRSAFRQRMWEYYAVLRLNLKRPVWPVVIYLSPGSGGVTTEVYQESLLGRQILRFEYDCVGLPDLPAEDYLQGKNPLAYGLAALMRVDKADRPAVKLACLRGIAKTETDPARLMLLTKLVDTYLRLSRAEEKGFHRLASKQKESEMSTYEEAVEYVMNYVTSWERRGLERGLEQGLEQGLKQGLKQAKSEELGRFLYWRFERTPAGLMDRLAPLTAAEIEVLIEAALNVADLEEFEEQLARATRNVLVPA